MSRPNWPGLYLSEQRLEELRAEAWAVDRNPFLALTTQVKLLASAESYSLAHKLLQLLVAEYPIASINTGMVLRLVAAAIIAHDPDCAVSLLEEWLSPPYRIVFEHGTNSGPAAVIQMQVRGQELRFQFSEGLFKARTAEMLIGRWLVIFEFFDRFMKSPDRVDGRVAISLDDGGSAPGLAFCDYRPGYYLIPDPHYMSQQRYNDIRQVLDAHQVAWDERAPVAFWRGSTTGQPTDPALGWRSLPRVRLCEIAAAFPAMFDAGITNVNQISGQDAYQDLEARNLLRPRVGRAEFMKYRYQIDIDGNTSSWDGFVMKLLTGGPVLKVRSAMGFEQWFYDRLEPWVNFVPVDSHMADLAEKVAWLRANDQAARAIGEAGRKLAESLIDEQEVSRVTSVIAAAIRTDAGDPIIDLRFAAGSPDNEFLASGWLEPAEDGVSASGVESSVLLPHPPGLGDFGLLIDVANASPLPRFMTIIVAGETLLRRSISGRATTYCLMPRSLVTAGEALKVSLQFSNDSIDESLAGLDRAFAQGITLHRIGVAAAHRQAWHGYPGITELLAELNSGAAASSVVHDLAVGGSDRTFTLPRGAQLLTVRTFFGTILYADVDAGRIRHGNNTEVPHNLFLVRHGNEGRLVRMVGDNLYVNVALRAEGSHATQDDWKPWAGRGMVLSLSLERSHVGSTEVYGLKGAGLFACAEHSGEFTLSRTRPDQWEQFSFAQAGC